MEGDTHFRRTTLTIKYEPCLKTAPNSTPMSYAMSTNNLAKLPIYFPCLPYPPSLHTYIYQIPYLKRLLPTTQPRPRIILPLPLPLLLLPLLLLRPSPLRIPPGTARIRTAKMTIILLLGRRRARRRRRRHIALGHILRPLILLLLLGRLPPRLVLWVLRRRRGEELLVRGR